MTLTLQEKFDKATSYVQGLPKDGPYQPKDEVKLKYYAFFKQGTVGDVNTSKPGMFDFVGRAKWDAWEKVKGTSKEEAQKKYIELLLKDLEEFAPDEFKKLREELEG